MSKESTDLLTGGLLRLPKFMKLVIQTIKDVQHKRITERSLISQAVQSQDVIYSLLICASLIAFRLAMSNLVMPKFFKNKSKQLTDKLTEDLYYTLYYTISFLYYVFGVLGHKDDSWKDFSLLSLFTNDNQSNIVQALLYPYPPDMTIWERWYYVQAFGFYLSASIFLLIIDGRRSDFKQYLLHHIVTVGMILFSYIYGYIRAGIIILVLHDVGDIFLYSSKFFHHLGTEGVDIFLFIIFTVVFYTSRLVAYSRIVYTINVETLQMLIRFPDFNEWAMYYDTYLIHYACFAVALSTLLWLHCFWYNLVLRLVGNELFFGLKITEQGDPTYIQSDDEKATKSKSN